MSTKAFTPNFYAPLQIQLLAYQSLALSSSSMNLREGKECERGH